MAEFRPAPKPTAADRRAAKTGRIRMLHAHRHEQATIAIERDGDLCVFCWFLEHKKVPRDDVHHVFGRGREAGDPQESYRHLLCTCRQHHPPPILAYRSKTELGGEVHAGLFGYVIEVMNEANKNPINADFRHPQKPEKR